MASRFRSDRRAVLAGLSALAVPGLVRAAEPLRVFAAASLKPVLDEVASGARLTYAGSGTIARQVAAGAPCDAVILAATDWMDWLSGTGTVTAIRPVARNALVLAGSEGSGPVRLHAPDLIERLGPGGRVAMGDPMSVPAGRYAQRALETLGLWTALQPRMILAENVRAALAYVARGDVAAGIVYASDATAPGIAVMAAFPPSSHAPIIYPGAVTRDAPAKAATFLDALAASPALTAHGFQAV
ncbi:molybdate ABC transporter substrate-binding protein [Jannaschia aquimarina]|uniref:ModA protein n=1 Tax=Jannaschia aquimarina TaxID=935700 RepID=A0A0D1E9Q7_9RHOB|nr:molybdate ABC transporter substrate-binding protein [Jannaschia aquimarina]KIT14419.1 Molybdate-binding periplasmic protein precursor [Jannaschia aquimarina]SNT29646.1 molybdate transport system substrate-binding protein [Jannaschia aquimarina]